MQCKEFVFFFFFQAEDGIRDGHVTGVQTCALPICRDRRVLLRAGSAAERREVCRGISGGGPVAREGRCPRLPRHGRRSRVRQGDDEVRDGLAEHGRPYGCDRRRLGRQNQSGPRNERGRPHPTFVAVFVRPYSRSGDHHLPGGAAIPREVRVQMRLSLRAILVVILSLAAIGVGAGTSAAAVSCTPKALAPSFPSTVWGAGQYGAAGRLRVIYIEDSEQKSRRG